MTSPLDASPDPLVTLEPHRKATVREIFGVDSDMVVPVFTERDSHVPEIDEAYRFDPQTTVAICAGFAFNRRVMVQGYHGTGKSTHIEQVAARLNWPWCASTSTAMSAASIWSARTPSSSRTASRSPNSATASCPGPSSAMSRCVFDEYDAGRPDVMFVIQRVLEAQGRLTLLDQNRVIRPAPGSACSRRPTRSASATPRASITAPSRSIRARWTAGRSSPR
jgi:cobaltochelatase CobS